MLNPTKILDALSALRLADPARRVFGAATHMYVLNPVVTNERIQQFQDEQQIVLPEDYAVFLTEIGNGGAGPCYGLLPLGDFEHNSVGVLSLPFPHLAHWNVTPSEFESQKQLGTQSLPEHFDDWYFSGQFINGAIPICHEGCGYYDLLVVTGDNAGTMWIDGRCSDGGIAPLTRYDGVIHTFASWYSEWITTSTQEAKYSS
jgi:hypothetical protein